MKNKRETDVITVLTENRRMPSFKVVYGFFLSQVRRCMSSSDSRVGTAYCDGIASDIRL